MFAITHQPRGAIARQLLSLFDQRTPSRPRASEPPRDGRPGDKQKLRLDRLLLYRLLKDAVPPQTSDSDTLTPPIIVAAEAEVGQYNVLGKVGA